MNNIAILTEEKIREIVRDELVGLGLATEGIQAPEGWGGIIGNPALTLDDIHRAAVAHMDKAMPEKGHGYFHVMAGFVAGAMWALKMEEGNHEMKPPREQL